MKTSVEKLGPSKVRLTVTVTVPEVDEAVDAAYKRMAKKVKVPGFRAGKAPRPVIDTHVGREAVIADAQDELLNDSYGKALDAEGIRPIANPEIGEIELMEPGKEFEFVAEVETRPELTLSSIKGLSVTLPSPTASDEEIDAQIDHTRERFATLEPVDDRGVQADDFVLLSFVGKVDGEEYDGNSVDKYLYEMNRGLMPAEFDEGLIGLRPGDEATISFEIPDTSSVEEYVGKTASFDVTVHEVKAKVLPVVDDEFASNVGGFDTVEEMRANLKEQMDRSKAIGRARELERSVRAALAERLEGEVPQQMVENTAGQMMRDFINGLESQGTNLKDYIAATGVSLETIQHDVDEQAAESVRQELALEALFRHQGWEITDADIEDEIMKIADSRESDPAELRRKWEETGVIAVLREQIMHRRAVEWLVDPANVEFLEESDEKAKTEKAKPKSKAKAAKAKADKTDKTEEGEEKSDAEPKKTKSKKAKTEE